MKKLIFCAGMLFLVHLAASPILINLIYEKSVNSLYSKIISVDSNETLENFITKVTGDISIKENGYTVISCLDGMGKNLLEKKLQNRTLNKIFKTKRPSLWINC